MTGRGGHSGAATSHDPPPPGGGGRRSLTEGEGGGHPPVPYPPPPSPSAPPPPGGGGSDAGGSDEAGFSLIEALVALLILAITTVGLIRAAEAHVDSVRGMEQRAAAQFVAENRLIELRLGVPMSSEVGMLGGRWRVAMAQRATDDADLRAVSVTATAADGGVGVTLDGFVDLGTTTRMDGR